MAKRQHDTAFHKEQGNAASSSYINFSGQNGAGGNVIGTVGGDFIVNHNGRPYEQWSGKQNCLQHLSFPEMYARQNSISGKRTKDTCEWIFAEQSYQTWRAQQGGLLCIIGHPGSGKSTLLEHVFQHIRKKLKGHNAVVLSFFFHGRGSLLEHSESGLLRTLIHQLLTEDAGARNVTEKIFHKSCDERGIAGTDWSWTNQDLKNLLRRLIQQVTQGRKLWIFVDALDEGGAVLAQDLAKQFLDLVSFCPDKLHICISCRYYPVLATEFALKIPVEEKNRKDIAIYLEAQFSDMRDDPEMMQRIKTLMVTRAGAIFQWAAIVVPKVRDDIASGMPERHILRSLEELPRGLSDLYEALMKQIQLTERDLCTKLFQWICFSMRPLTLDELQHALAIDAEIETVRLTSFKNSANFTQGHCRLVKRIRHLSKGLIEVRETKKTTPSAKKKRSRVMSPLSEVTPVEAVIVQFVHQSVKDFFLETTGRINVGERLAVEIDPTQSHALIAKYCLQYLNMEERTFSSSKEQSSVEDFPLLAYASFFWIRHAQESESGGAMQASLPSLLQSRLLTRWHTVCTDANKWPMRYLAKRNSTACHILAGCGILSGLRELIGDETCLLDQLDSRRKTPLSLAAEFGYDKVVDLMLASGRVCVNSADISGRTALYWAAKNNHEAIVQILIEASQNPRLIDLRQKNSNKQSSPLVSDEANPEASRAIREVFNRGSSSCPLVIAASRGHRACVRLLLNSKMIDIDCAKLDAIIERSSPQMNQFLLDKVAIDNFQILVWLRIALNGRKIKPAKWLAQKCQSADPEFRRIILENARDGEVLRVVNLKDFDATDINDMLPRQLDEVGVKLLLETGKVAKQTIQEAALQVRSPGIVRVILATNVVEVDIIQQMFAQTNFIDILAPLLDTGKVERSLVASKFFQVKNFMTPQFLNRFSHLIDSNTWTELLLHLTLENLHNLGEVSLDDHKIGPRNLWEQLESSIAKGDMRKWFIFSKLCCRNVVALLQMINKEWAMAMSQDSRSSSETVLRDNLVILSQISFIVAVTHGSELMIETFLKSKLITEGTFDFALQLLDNYGEDNGNEESAYIISSSKWTKVTATILLHGQGNLICGFENIILPHVVRFIEAERKRDDGIRVDQSKACSRSVPETALHERSSAGQTPLAIAASKGYAGIVSRFLECSTIEMNAQDLNGFTALSLAAANGHSRIVTMLLDTQQADVNLQDSERRSPISYAAVWGHLEVVKVLIASGKVNLFTRDKNGKNCFDIASDLGHHDILEYLLKHA